MTAIPGIPRRQPPQPTPLTPAGWLVAIAVLCAIVGFALGVRW